MDPDVPLVIPEVNAHHLGVIDAQRQAAWLERRDRHERELRVHRRRARARAAFMRRSASASIFVATMQAVSGAGYPGVASLDILGNVIPFIADEEPKIESEIAKLLGTVSDASITSARFRVTAHANRVPVEHGHTVCMSIGLRRCGDAGGGNGGDRELDWTRGGNWLALERPSIRCSSRRNAIVRSRAATSDAERE